MMPPVSLPLNGGTVSARAGPPAIAPHIITKAAAVIIRIVVSILFPHTLMGIGAPEKNRFVLGGRLSAGVAAAHLTFRGLHGTVPATDHSADFIMSSFLSILKKTSICVALGALLGLMTFTPAAQAANPLELNFWLSGPRYDGAVPSCESALSTISSQFSEKESTFWNSALQITGYDRVRETTFRPWTSDNMPRRFCTARAMLNDGRPRTVSYSIVEDGGLAGYGPGVEWCVVGLDRNWAYNPHCKAAGP